MAKASDNEFPKLLLVPSAAPVVPAGSVGVFIDPADGHLKRVDDTGTVTDTEAGGGGGGTPGRVLLKEVALAADTATISFTSADIPASGYNHLELVVTGRTTQAATQTPITASINGDTADANYYRQTTGIIGSAAYNTASAAREIGYLAGASAAAGHSGSFRTLIADYTGTAFFKTAASVVSAAANFAGTVGYTWKNTAAITSIDLTNPASFKAGTVARLYGLT